MTMAEALAITAAAALTPYGLRTEDFVSGFPRGPLAFQEEESLGVYLRAAGPVSAAFVPEYDTRKALNTRAISHFDRLTRHLCVATEMLHEELGFEDLGRRREYVEDERVSMVVGSNGPIQSILAYDLQAIRDPQYVQPGLFPNAVYNVPASYAAIRRSIRGSCITLTNGGTSVVDAFGIALKQVRSGRIDLALVGGAEEVTPAYATYVRALALQQGQTPQPLSEGAYLFCVEEAGKAEARGQAVFAHLLGTASVFCPEAGRGLRECLDRLTTTTGEDLAALRWVCTDGPVAPSDLGLPCARIIPLEATLGYLGAMYAAAGVLAVLSDPKVQPGEKALVLCANPEGACGALLLEKRRSLS